MLNRSSTLTLIGVLYLVNIVQSSNEIQCVDEHNEPVDWIILYKLPRNVHSSEPLIQNGEAYMHISSKDTENFEQQRRRTQQKEFKPSQHQTSFKRNQFGFENEGKNRNNHFHKDHHEHKQVYQGIRSRKQENRGKVQTKNDKIEIHESENARDGLENAYEIQKYGDQEIHQNGLENEHSRKQEYRRKNRKRIDKFEDAPLKSRSVQNEFENVSLRKEFNEEEIQERNKKMKQENDESLNKLRINFDDLFKERVENLDRIIRSVDNMDTVDVLGSYDELNFVNVDGEVIHLEHNAKEIDLESGNNYEPDVFIPLKVKDDGEFIMNEIMNVDKSADPNGMNFVKERMEDVSRNKYSMVNSDGIMRSENAEGKMNLSGEKLMREKMEYKNLGNTPINELNMVHNDELKTSEGNEQRNDAIGRMFTEKEDDEMVLKNVKNMPSTDSSVVNLNEQINMVDNTNIETVGQKEFTNEQIKNENLRNKEMDFEENKKNIFRARLSDLMDRINFEQNVRGSVDQILNEQDKAENLEDDKVDLKKKKNKFGANKSCPSDRMDSQQFDQSRRTTSYKWIFSNYSITDVNSIPSKILSTFLFTNKDSFQQDGVKILYNDQTLNSTTVKYGHTKGIVLGNSKGGVWVVHSVPHFIDDTQNEYTYPKTGHIYGQNFLCLSLSADQLDSVGDNLGYNQIYKYSTYISENNKDKYKTLNKIINNAYKPVGNSLKNTILTKFTNYSFRAFSKTREFNRDLYEFVGETLEEDLYVETWPNGPGRLRSNCTIPTRLVENVVEINTNMKGVNFSSTHDHSKWAINFKIEKKNRFTFENERHGGGAEKRDIVGKENGRRVWMSGRGLDQIALGFENVKLSGRNRNENGEIKERYGTSKESFDDVDAIGTDMNKGDVDAIEDRDYQFVDSIVRNVGLEDKEVENEEDYEEFVHERNVEKQADGQFFKVEEYDGAIGFKGKHYVCNGDINRAEDQLKRGGGTLCVDNEELWQLYHSLIEKTEGCPKP